jgi:Abortive infection C-terminus
VLLQLGRPVNEKADIPALVRQAQEALKLLPTSGTDGPDGTQALSRILGGLMNITNGLAELRNRGYGTGHGPSGARAGLRPLGGQCRRNLVQPHPRHTGRSRSSVG